MSSSSPNVLITGAAGFLGTYLGELCAERGFSLFGIDSNPPVRPEAWQGFRRTRTEAADFVGLLDGVRLDYAFHLSGSASVPLSVATPRVDFDKLLPGTAALLDFLRAHQPSAHAVLFSSAAVYGNPRSLPVFEDAPLVPISPYGVHKLVAETLWMHTARIQGLRASVIRIFSAFGAGLRKQLFWDVVRKYSRWKRGETPDVEMFGTGDETRDFVHARDVARAAVAVAERSTGAIVNVASGEEVSIRAATRMLLGAEVPVRFNGQSRPGDPLNWRADVSRLRALGWEPKVGVAEALREYFDFAIREIDA
jgi:UDP-glucose 4-epimerase